MMFRNIKGIHIDGRKHMSVDNEVMSFLNPKFVYFPLVSGNVVYKRLVEDGETVKVGQQILLRTDRFSHPVHSSVSGTVKGIKKMWHPFGKMVEMLEIENDFQETLHESIGTPLAELTKDAIVERMHSCGIVGLGGAGLPTFVKYQKAADSELLLINAAECEPYITCDQKNIQINTDKLIRGIKYALIASGAKEAKICIKKSKVEEVQILEEALKDINNINVFLLKDVYPAGWERYIVEKVTKKTYKALPTEIGVVVNNVGTMIAVCDAVEQNQPLVQKLVTFTGEGLAHPCNVVVKNGTKTSDVIKSIGGYVEGLTDAYFVVGGPMTGTSIMFDEVVLLAASTAVLVKPKVERITLPCLGCGKCAENCPVFLTPTEVKSALEDKDYVALNALNTTACIQCGLCSYVCPSRIDVTDTMKKAKDAVWKYNATKK